MCFLNQARQIAFESNIVIVNHSLLISDMISGSTLIPEYDLLIIDDLLATGGTVLASKLALEYKLACNTAGGGHHASYDFGAGYCVFNDTAVAANYLKKKGYAKKILILDLDVHQGNGNSEIFQNDKNIKKYKN